MSWLERIWGVLAESMFAHIDPQTLVATVVLAIPAVIIGYLMLYFEKSDNQTDEPKAK